MSAPASAARAWPAVPRPVAACRSPCLRASGRAPSPAGLLPRRPRWWAQEAPRAAFLQANDAGLGFLRLQAGSASTWRAARARPPPAPGPAHHQQVVGEPDEHPVSRTSLPGQPVQVDVASRADRTALGGPGHLPPNLAVLHDPGAQDLPQELEDGLVNDAFLDRLHQLPVRNRRKATGDVRLDHPPAAPPSLIDDDLEGVVRRPLRAEPETARQEVRLENRFKHDLQGGLHDPVANRGDRKGPVLILQARLGDQHPASRQRPVSSFSQFGGQLVNEPERSVLVFDLIQRGLVNAGCAVAGAHRDPPTPQDIPAEDLVPQRVKPTSGIGLGRPVQRVLQGTHLIQPRTSAAGGTSRRIGTHRAPPATSSRIDEAGALPSPPVMLSGRLKRYYDPLRRPPGPLSLPGSSPVIDRDAPPRLRSQVGRGGPLQFPPPLSARSAPLTPRDPSRLHLQDLHRFHGLRPSPPGSASPRPRHTARSLNDAAGFTSRYGPHSCTPPNRGARRWAPTPPVSRRDRQPATGPPDSYPDRTSTGKRRRAYESVVNHSFDQPPIPTGRTGGTA